MKKLYTLTQKNYSYKYKKANIHNYFKVYLITKKSICKKKGIEFDLDFEWFIERYYKGCELTGLAFITDLNNKTNGPYSPFQVSVDRIDSTMGYIKSNCRLILFSLNTFKGKWNDEDIMLIAEEFVRSTRLASRLTPQLIKLL